MLYLLLLEYYFMLINFIKRSKDQVDMKMRIKSIKSEIEERSERAERQKAGRTWNIVEYPQQQLKLLPLEGSIALTTARLERQKDSDAGEEGCREKEG